MKWEILDTGCRSPQENMELDAALLEDLDKVSHPILHLYDWEGDSATFGHFVKPEDFLNLEGVKKRGMRLAKRPTGGGIIFHNCDFAFSVLVPATHVAFSSKTLENYAFVNQMVKDVIALFVKGTQSELLKNEEEPLDVSCMRFCMAKPTKYDVMLQGKKVGGAAQRLTKKGFLHQGSIFLGFLPQEYLEDMLLPETRVLEGMRQHSFPLIGENWTEKDLSSARQEIKHHLIAYVEGGV